MSWQQDFPYLLVIFSARSRGALPTGSIPGTVPRHRRDERMSHSSMIELVQSVKSGIGYTSLRAWNPCEHIKSTKYHTLLLHLLLCTQSATVRQTTSSWQLLLVLFLRMYPTVLYGRPVPITVLCICVKVHKQYQLVSHGGKECGVCLGSCSLVDIFTQSINHLRCVHAEKRRQTSL